MADGQERFPIPILPTAFRAAYATSSTDTGHTGGSGSFVLGHPEKFVDFACRSEHEMTVKSKLIVAAMYGGPAKYSFWKGCSTGGRQAMKEFQVFPNDFDGVIAGSQANPRTGMALLQASVAFAALKDPASRIPVSKLPMIHESVLKACDALDGLRDGLIQDPRKCKFRPDGARMQRHGCGGLPDARPSHCGAKNV